MIWRSLLDVWINGAMAWMFVFPFNSYAEILTHSVIRLGNGALAGWLGYGDNSPMNGICALGKEAPAPPLHLALCVAQWEKMAVCEEAGPHIGHRLYQQFNFGLLSFWNCEKITFCHLNHIVCGICYSSHEKLSFCAMGFKMGTFNRNHIYASNVLF